MDTHIHMGTFIAQQCCTPIVSPLHKGTLCSRGRRAEGVVMEVETNRVYAVPYLA